MLTQEEIIKAQGLQNTTPTNVPSATSNTFLQTLQEKLLSQSDMISSANTNIESKINEAIAGIKSSAQSSSQAIASQYDRQIGYTNEAQQNQITAARERGVGMSTSDVAYKAMTAEADKNLKDLEMRKNELILQGDAAAASKIADLQVQTLEFKTKAMQQTFTNLLSVGSFGIQAQESQRAQQAQNFLQSSKVAEIGLQYGIPVSPNDTLESIVTKAAPKASEIQKQQMAKLVAETNLANANAAKALNDNKLPNLNNPTELALAGELYRRDPASIVSKSKTTTELGKIQAEAKKQELSQAEQITNQVIAEMQKSGVPVDGNTVYATVSSRMASAGLPLIAPIDVANKVSEIASQVKNPPVKKSTLPEDLKAIKTGFMNTSYGVSDYLFGQDWRKNQAPSPFSGFK